MRVEKEDGKAAGVQCLDCGTVQDHVSSTVNLRQAGVQAGRSLAIDLAVHLKDQLTLNGNRLNKPVIAHASPSKAPW
jgi:hypothetical protein